MINMKKSGLAILSRKLQQVILLQRCNLSSSSSSTSSTRTIQVPTTNPLKSWESGARLVKNTNVENQYLEHIRDMHDPSQHLKTIEDELKGTIGQALRKQADKILLALRCMKQEHETYQSLLANGHALSSAEVVKVAKKYDEFRKEAHHRRWELIVHRQAVGFTVGNHSYVIEKFPIPEPLPEQEQEAEPSNKESDLSKPKKTFGDQLDWWQKIGRWR